MALVEMLMPKMGESIMEATILGWLKKEGDKIEQDESVLEVATDKVDTEVPATHAGILKEILAKEGDIIPVGNPIARIATNGEDNQEVPVVELERITEEPVKLEETAVDYPPPSNSSGNQVTKTRFYSPLVLNIARKEDIPMEELENISGTGKEGRVTKKDILSYLATRTNQPLSAPESLGPEIGSAPADLRVADPTQRPETMISKPSVGVEGGDEILEMDRMRRIIAERMVESKRISAHVTSFVEADVTDLVNWRNQHKEDFKQKEGENLTLTPLFIEAVIAALRNFPMLNISIEGDTIIKKKAINIGIAVALPSGNLIVPVIHNADHYNLIGLTKKVNDLAERARSNRLNPDELTGGTYTISNVGSFGNLMGTPIIVQPQVAILATGAITKKPAVIETPKGDTIGIRQKIFLSHSYDHRIIDGALGGMFVRNVADYLEQFDINRRI